jgi:hypothetical protein
MLRAAARPRLGPCCGGLPPCSRPLAAAALPLPPPPARVRSGSSRHSPSPLSAGTHHGSSTSNSTPSAPRHRPAAAATSEVTSSPNLTSLLRPAGYLDVGSVQPGDSLCHPGDLIIHGSVSPGAEIVASGDVVCLGSLQGSVHAGADLGQGANGSARIVAMEFRRARIKVAGTATLGDAKVRPFGPGSRAWERRCALQPVNSAFRLSSVRRGPHHSTVPRTKHALLKGHPPRPPLCLRRGLGPLLRRHPAAAAGAHAAEPDDRGDRGVVLALAQVHAWGGGVKDLHRPPCLTLTPPIADQVIQQATTTTQQPTRQPTYRAYPAAVASMVTGVYALLAGAALVAAPKTVFG